MEPYPLIACFAIILLAAFVQGATAFGFALVAVPLLLIFMPATETVSLSLVLGSILNVLMIRDQKKEIAWREVAPLLPAMALAVVAGMLLLKNFDSPAFKAVMALAFLAMAATMLLNPQIKPGSSQLLRLTVGAASGLLTGATSMGGPPVVLYLAGRGLSQPALRGTLALFFLLGNMFALLAFLTAGLIDAGIAYRSLLLTAAIVPGYAAGKLLTSRLSCQAFRRLVMTAMAATALLELALNLAAI